MESTPFHQRLSLNLISLSLLILLLYLAKTIFIPIFFAILLGTLLLPAFNYLRKKKLPRPIAILIPLIFSLVLFATVVYFLSNQVVHFFDDLPALKKKLAELGSSIQNWFGREINIPINKQNKYLQDGIEKIQENGTLFSSTMSTLKQIGSYLVLLPIYTFLIMYYKDRIRDFLINEFKNKNGSTTKVRATLSECTDVAQRYVLGLCIETVLVFTLNTIGFLILGIAYPIFLALLAALLNLIPYVGMLVANIICIVITLVTSDSPADAVWVGVILLIVQFYDNNFGMPLIVGNKVRINALVTIVGIMVGAALSGIPGMFLAIPGLAVIKVVCDRVPELQPWGMLLSDTSETKKQKIK